MKSITQLRQEWPVLESVSDECIQAIRKDAMDHWKSRGKIVNNPTKIHEASATLPVVDRLVVAGKSPEEARMRLWIVTEAVKSFQSKQCKAFSEWTENDRKRTLKAMEKAMSNPKGG